MHRTAPLQFLPSLKNGFCYYQSVWNQRNYLLAWERHGRKAVRLLAVQERSRASGPAIVEVKDREPFDLEQALQYVQRESNTENVIRRLQAVLDACSRSSLTIGRLDVLRRVLSVSLKREDRQQIAGFLERKAAEEELSSTVRPFLESFLTIFQVSKLTLVATVLSLGRLEDALRPEYLEMKIAQLTDLYSVNRLTRWLLIVVEESREGVSTAQWLALAHEKFGDQMSHRQLQFLHAPAEAERPPNWFKGGSILFGMAHAVKEGSDYVIFTDAKPAIDLGQEGWLLKYAVERGNHVVIGSRYLSDSRLVRCSKRRFTSRLYNLAVSAILPQLSHMRDTQCGFKCFTASAFGGLQGNKGRSPFGVLKDKGLSFDTELLGKAVLLNFSIAEVPIVSVWPHPESWRIKEAIHMLIGVIRQRYRLVALDYLTRGKSATVFVSHDRRRVVKVLHRTSEANSSTAWANTGRPSFDLPLAFFARVGQWALRHPQMVAVVKWIQRQPLLRSMALRAYSFAQQSRHAAVETVEQASISLPGDVAAPFRIRQGQWVVLAGRFCNRVVKVTAIEQEAVQTFLEGKLGEVICNGDLDSAKRLIDDALAVQVRMWRYGFFNSDANLLSDTGFDSHGNMVFVDMGDLTRDYKTALEYLQDVHRSFGHVFTVQSLRRLSLTVADYYCEQFTRIFSPTNFKTNWNADTPSNGCRSPPASYVCG